VENLGQLGARSTKRHEYWHQLFSHKRRDFLALRGRYRARWAHLCGGPGLRRNSSFLANGAYSFSITNGFGGGQSFSQPLGMITDKAGNLYVADNGNNCVFEFSGSGTFIQKFGGIGGSAPGQLSGVRDVAVSTNGQVYVLENGNSRVSSFNPDGSFNSVLITNGSLDGQLSNPVSIAISDSGKIFVAQDYISYQGRTTASGSFLRLKAFDTNGNFLFLTGTGGAVYYMDPCNHIAAYVFLGSCSVRVDRSGWVHVIDSSWGTYYTGCNDPNPNFQMTWSIYNLEGSVVNSYQFSFGPEWDTAKLYWPCQAVGPDGTVFIADANTGTLQQYYYAKREIEPVPRNASSMPEVLAVTERPTNGVVDITYQVNDMDDASTFAAMLVFTNGIQSLSDCLQPASFTEGTGAKYQHGRSDGATHSCGVECGRGLGHFQHEWHQLPSRRSGQGHSSRLSGHSLLEAAGRSRNASVGNKRQSPCSGGFYPGLVVVIGDE